jgi:hypothetical protein
MKVSIDKTLGYKYFLDKNHPLSNKQGKVYLHRHVALFDLGINPIGMDVHHINGDKLDNNPQNLTVVSKSIHAKLHNPLKRSLIGTCKKCLKKFKKQNKKSVFCSVICKRLASRKTNRPNYNKLKKLIDNHSFVYVGKMFGVSDNAVRKWIKLYERSASPHRPSKPKTLNGGKDVSGFDSLAERFSHAKSCIDLSIDS